MTIQEACEIMENFLDADEKRMFSKLTNKQFIAINEMLLELHLDKKYINKKLLPAENYKVVDNRNNKTMFSGSLDHCNGYLKSLHEDDSTSDGLWVWCYIE